jgi:hypothetical protein
MRLSLSVPDALWLQACEAYRLSAPSRLVQAALESLVADARVDDLQGPPADSRDRLGRLQDRLRGEARAAYEEGYQAGLELAEVVEWWVVEQLADAGWSLDRLGTRGRAGPVHDELRRHLAGRTSPSAAALISDLERGEASRVSAFATGLMTALRECLASGSAAQP